MDNTKVLEEKFESWHAEMRSVAEVVAHLLDSSFDDVGVPDWRRSAAWLMRNRVVALVDECPFPDFQQGTAAQKEVSGDCCA